ncbi:hypothetical protein LUX39_28840 [Actinomadura madurae]|nr:hypothetical protein [Actinomadura madurae]MCQ0007406.1 hypothetical protein [Actinomadura madurae]MCQ0017293.1 hypothetical protein [Actinomadura madurae]
MPRLGVLLAAPGHQVVGDLGEQVAVRVEEPDHRPPRLQRRDGAQLRPAGACRDQARQPRRDDQRPAERSPQLLLAVRPGRHLEMPSGVGPAPPPAQRDPRGGEPQAGGVEVGGVQLVDLGLLDRRHARQPVQVRQGEGGRGVVLLLDLQMPFGHALLLRADR